MSKNHFALLDRNSNGTLEVTHPCAQQRDLHTTE